MADNQSARIQVRVTPRSSKRELRLLESKKLAAHVHGAAVDGNANDELLALLARELDVPISTLEIVRGVKSREKLIAISGMTEEDLLRRIK